MQVYAYGLVPKKSKIWNREKDNYLKEWDGVCPAILALGLNRRFKTKLNERTVRARLNHLRRLP